MRRASAKAEVSSENQVFALLCQLLEDVEKLDQSKRATGIRKGDAVENIVHDFFTSLEKGGLGDLQQTLRLMVPELDRERVYDMKEYTLLKELLSAYGLQKGHRRTKWLEDYRTEAWKGHDESIGDLSLRVKAFVVNRGSPTTPTITINAMHNALEYLASVYRQKQSGCVHERTVKRNGSGVLSDLFVHLTAVEAKWAVRIILKDMRFKNIRPSHFFNGFHELMNRIWIRNSNFVVACRRIKAVIQAQNQGGVDSKFIQDQLCPSIGVYVSVALCRRMSPDTNKMVASLANAPYPVYYCEQKYDGERIQIHYSKDLDEKVRIFSRGGRDSTADRIDVKEHILACLGTSTGIDAGDTVQECILDGELLAYDETRGEILPFGTVQQMGTRFGEDIKKGRHLLVVLFDILWYNGLNYMPKPLEERRERLKKIIKPRPNHVHISDAKRVDLRGSQRTAGMETIKLNFGRSLAQRQEGIVVKHIHSKYIPNNRQWYKMKRYYDERLRETVTMAVIGAQYSQENSLGAYLCTLVVGLLVNKHRMERGEDDEPRFLVLLTVPVQAHEQAKEFHQYMRQWGEIDKKLGPTLQWQKYPWLETFPGGPMTDCVIRVPSHIFVIDVKYTEFLINMGGEPTPLRYLMRFPQFGGCHKYTGTRAYMAGLTVQEYLLIGEAMNKPAGSQELQVHAAYLGVDESEMKMGLAVGGHLDLKGNMTPSQTKPSPKQTTSCSPNISSSRKATPSSPAGNTRSRTHARLKYELEASSPYRSSPRVAKKAKYTNCIHQSHQAEIDLIANYVRVDDHISQPVFHIERRYISPNERNAIMMKILKIKGARIVDHLDGECTHSIVSRRSFFSGEDDGILKLWRPSRLYRKALERRGQGKSYIAYFAEVLDETVERWPPPLEVRKDSFCFSTDSVSRRQYYLFKDEESKYVRNGGTSYPKSELARQ